MLTDKTISEFLSELKINFSAGQKNKLLLYLDILLEKNKSINITGSKTREDIFIRQILDSLSIFKYFDYKQIPLASELGIIDIGSGGGLPGIPMAIFMEKSNFTLLDSRNKISLFLADIINHLTLKNVRALNGRAEILSREDGYREKFDLVVSRAVGNTRVISELAIPFCAKSGKIIFYKSRKVADEIEGAGKTINLLGAGIEELFEVKVPNLDEYRSLLILKKESNTLYKYPRKYAKIIKTPLICL
jgi:16S rRNA (guanine527-N7)-methyltransferase